MPTNFQRAILVIFSDLLNHYLEIFVCDLIPYCDAFETTLAHLEKVLEFYLYNKVALSTEKCQMMMTEGIMLGHYINAKIEVILKIRSPRRKKR